MPFVAKKKDSHYFQDGWLELGIFTGGAIFNQNTGHRPGRCG
jgi:hypothetical protein